MRAFGTTTREEKHVSSLAVAIGKDDDGRDSSRSFPEALVGTGAGEAAGSTVSVASAQLMSHRVEADSAVVVPGVLGSCHMYYSWMLLNVTGPPWNYKIHPGVANEPER